jgi:formylglycine-generating enzyme required for sulfatase activity
MRVRGQHILLLAVFASPAAAQSTKPGTVFKDCADCPEMVVVPTGVFTMGTAPEQAAAIQLPADQASREAPAHVVTIANPIAVGRYELTVAEYAAFVRDTNRETVSGCITWDQAANKWGEVASANWENPGYEQTPKHPVGCISLPEARDYAKWLSQKSGAHYRLPSEAEWEYIARADEPEDADNICARANVSDASRIAAHGSDGDATRAFSCDDKFVYASPVGSFPPNAFGLYDVIGNIWVWTEDCYVATYEGAPADGSARKDKGCDRFVVRGGGWYSRTFFARAAGRSRETPEWRASTLGIRLVRDLTR